MTRKNNKKTFSSHSTLICWGFLGFAVGCGSSPSPVEVDAAIVEIDSGTVPQVLECNSTDGARLARESIQVNSDAREEGIIIDTQTGVECGFRANPDGTHSCYPASAVTGGAVFFQDLLCETPIVGFIPKSTPKAFIASPSPTADGCSTIHEYREVTTILPIVSGNPIFERDSVGNCVARVAPSRDYYRAGPPLTSADFVSATLTPVSTTTRLSSSAFVGEDGSSMCPSSPAIVDQLLGVNCSLQLDSASALRCMPIASGPTNGFSDATCGKGVAVDFSTQGTCAAEPAAFTVTTDVNECIRVIREVREVSNQQLTSVFTGTPISCVDSTVVEESYFQVGNVADPTGFVAMSEQIEEGSDRIVRRLSVTDENVRFFADWYDTLNESNCSFSLASDDVLRCLPTTVGVQTLFSDAACGSTILGRFETLCDGVPKFFRTNLSGGRRKILKAELYQGIVYERVGSPAVCTIKPGDFYERTFEVAASSFQFGEFSLSAD